MAKHITVATRDELDQLVKARITKGWTARTVADDVELHRVRQNRRGWLFLFGSIYLLYELLTGGREQVVLVSCQEAPPVRQSSDGRYWSTDGITWHEAEVTPPPVAAESA